MLQVAIVGATGYTGEELIRILLNHPKVKLTSLAALIDKPRRICDIFPQFGRQLCLVCRNLDINAVAKKAELVFLALPHRVSMRVAPAFLKKGKKVIDLSADYRLQNPQTYKRWYGTPHKDKLNLKHAVYGLPELYAAEIKRATLVANPGCYPTGAILGVLPFLKNKKIDTSMIIIDAKSGTSGAGRRAALTLLHSEVNENIKAYKVNAHQHMPEIEQVLSDAASKKLEINFVPHLIPISRGILTTLYFRLKQTLDYRKLLKVCEKFYQSASFVRVLGKGALPEIKNVVGTNFCDLALKVDNQKKTLIVITAIDNLGKGAAGQAVENMNLICGFKQTLGLL